MVLATNWFWNLGFLCFIYGFWLPGDPFWLTCACWKCRFAKAKQRINLKTRIWLRRNVCFEKLRSPLYKNIIFFWNGASRLGETHFFSIEYAKSLGTTGCLSHMYIYIYIYTHIHAYTHTHKHKQNIEQPRSRRWWMRSGRWRRATARPHTYIYVYVHIYIYIYIYAHTHICMCAAWLSLASIFRISSISASIVVVLCSACVCVYVYMRVCVCIYIYIYTYEKGSLWCRDFWHILCWKSAFRLGETLHFKRKWCFCIKGNATFQNKRSA